LSCAKQDMIVPVFKHRAMQTCGPAFGERQEGDSASWILQEMLQVVNV
jgi:hypothetical protein